MKFFTALTFASVIAPAVAVPAVPAIKADGTCINPPKRVEWRELSAANQKGYIDAVLCLKTKPSRIGLKESTLYDDFPYVHFKLNAWSKFFSFKVVKLAFY